MIKKYFSVFSVLTGMVVSTGCATVNDYLASMNKKENPPLEKIATSPRYSDSQNMGVPTDRQYKRMTKNRMEEESDLGSNAGSTWVMEGQGAYLFAQNKMRREGDLLNVKLDAPAMKQVETKVSVIKKLLKQLEEQNNPQPALGNSLAANGEAGRAPASAEAPAPAAKEEPKKEDDKEGLADIQAIPSRIVEKMPDGNYRLKGQQPFMIGKREYKVILTGMIRPEDFNDEGITTQKLLDPQYDVVSIRRNKSNE
ncbi:flagellar basal body L-ring protein FlgH [Bdellovibrio svalbardensis]|uniref:Flagellar basal body L-ring protein FlgH n=1 Tax=Bdellovibrio svalbardensis TaxID=2972972 RepID=A0ABT6DJH4_9BACT|nr:flagellar basal body L-ring protein FlgH [Bdellovibrio svalbardensis]MDG0817013.1 flagellar basal body L-ring protein FlgH [Bdellovibrio svalbardensis]